MEGKDAFALSIDDGVDEVVFVREVVVDGVAAVGRVADVVEGDRGHSTVVDQVRGRVDDPLSR